MYRVKLKWEPEGKSVVWGIATVTVGRRLGLLRKGVVLAITDANPEWSRWLDLGSTNCKQTWRSMFPSLLINSIWFSSTSNEIVVNLWSLMWGVGVKGYPSEWWRGRLLRFFKEQDLRRILTLKQMFLWVAEGKGTWTSKSVYSW